MEYVILLFCATSIALGMMLCIEGLLDVLAPMGSRVFFWILGLFFFFSPIVALYYLAHLLTGVVE